MARTLIVLGSLLVCIASSACGGTLAMAAASMSPQLRDTDHGAEGKSTRRMKGDTLLLVPLFTTEFGGDPERRELVIRDSVSFLAYWERATGSWPLPEPLPDFERELVIALSLGRLPMLTSLVHVRSAHARGDTMQVNVQVEYLAPYCPAGQAVTQPQDIVRILGVPPHVTFTTDSVMRRDCNFKGRSSLHEAVRPKHWLTAALSH